MSECLMDFFHEHIWCQHHYDSDIQRRIAFEMRRANDLKEEQLRGKARNDWQEPEVPLPRQYPTPTQPEKLNFTRKGGISVVPRRLQPPDTGR